ncbi:LnmK family bifunctional acyltransferase/decarboxylase [Actinokineospora iranica]|uniref:Biosynthesis cluster domain-containing protein n=1 Tax=Actinokineospora iranica TaxID=1271860 RepID=A0A1G6WA43_9PSEU|nr:LnmK family bifunctional acyltransferase/decarboxylase [Actinokineospora iranica]SDD61926.1 biosynthesis cluster domain-containing protein [Actinokineospora iranica]
MTTAATRAQHPEFEIVDDHTVWRRLTIRPGMCGHNSLFVGQVGDWTWETVSTLCGTNVFAARDASGAPTYLAFYYFHIRGNPAFHHGALTFGDRIEVTSSSFDYGSESVLTLHRISRTPGHRAAIDPVEFFEDQRPDCLYVQNFNRWVTRSDAKSNLGLVKSSPPDFRHGHLPTLPAKHSPRLTYKQARTAHTFHDVTSPDYRQAGTASFDYGIDITRDINGVGLIYFASYFSIVDKAVLTLWRELGRSDESFLNRAVLDHKLCYLGNANLDSILRVSVQAFRSVADPGHEVFNVVATDRGTGKAIAVSTIHLTSEVPQ